MVCCSTLVAACPEQNVEFGRRPTEDRKHTKAVGRSQCSVQASGVRPQLKRTIGPTAQGLRILHPENHHEWESSQDRLDDTKNGCTPYGVLCPSFYVITDKIFFFSFRLANSLEMQTLDSFRMIS